MQMGWSRRGFLTGLLCLGVITSGCFLFPMGMRGNVSIQNNLDFELSGFEWPDAELVEVNFVPSDEFDADWGPNLLESPIPPGTARALLIPPGVYTVRAVSDAGTEWTWLDREVLPGIEYRWLIRAPDTPGLVHHEWGSGPPGSF